VQAAGGGQVALVGRDDGEVGEVTGGVALVGTDTGLADRQRALEQGGGLVEVALAVQNVGKVVEADGGLGGDQRPSDSCGWQERTR
jgi:hypothetical protein